MQVKELFGIELPIIQAPMAGVQGSALAIAVSNAGGLGSLPCATLSPELIQYELAQIQAGTTQPFNVNFFCHQIPKFDETKQQAWLQILQPYYAELGVDTKQVPTGAGRLPFDQVAADILQQFRPPIVSFHFGLPNQALLQQLRSWGAKIIASATTLAEGLWLEAQGVDAIIAQGLEAGGHRGMFLTEDLTTQMGTLALVPQLVKAVKLPVIAAGGIADAKGVQAVLSLGAIAAQVGTAYLLCPEATTSSLHRQVLSSASAQHTALTNIFTGRPARGVVNRLMWELGAMHPQAPAFPLATNALTPLRAQAETLKSADFSPLWAGQNTQGCKAVGAGELTKQLTTMCRNYMAAPTGIEPVAIP